MGSSDEERPHAGRGTTLRDSSPAFATISVRIGEVGNSATTRDDQLIVTRLLSRAVTGFLSGSGGLLSTTEDYFRFAQMMLNGGQLNGKRFIKASTVELMRTNVLAMSSSWG